MTESVILATIGLISTVLGYFYGRKKSNAEVKALETDNDKEIFSTYKTELEYFSTQLELCRNEIKELRTEISILVKSACGVSDCPNRLKINN